MKREAIFKYDSHIVDKVDVIYKVENTFMEEKVWRRFNLNVSLKRENADKKLLFIMMNPSCADSEKADKTVKQSIKYVWENRNSSELLAQVKVISFVNLYVVYEKCPAKVNEKIDKYGLEFVKGTDDDIVNNDNIIKANIQSADFIIFACGESAIIDYKKRMTEIKEMLKSVKAKVFTIGDITKLGYPRHPSRISYSLPLKEHIL